MREKIVYHSSDFDGCFSNESFTIALGNDWSTKSKEEVDAIFISTNRGILDSFAKDVKTVLLVGSNRQTPYIDHMNGSQKNSGSVYPRMEAVAAHLGENARFDTFLNSDLEDDIVELRSTYQKFKDKYLEDNGSYQKNIKQQLFKTDGFKEPLDDESKVSLLFAQMQVASMENPDEDIVFNFYDDRQDIVEGLQKFYKEHPELIPKNVTLNLIGYSGPKLTREEVQERMPLHFTLYTTSKMDNEATQKMMEEAGTSNDFPIFFKIPGEPEQFQMYCQLEKGGWGLKPFDGNIPGMEKEQFSKMFPTENEGRSYPTTTTYPSILNFLKKEHILPIPEKRPDQKTGVYNYGDPQHVDSILGKGPIPEEIEQWKPLYKSMREVSKELLSGDKKHIHVANNFTLSRFIAHLYTKNPDIVLQPNGFVAQKFMPIRKACLMS